jgi:toxin ParE1/3/4
MKVRYRDRALSDLDQIFQYIDQRSPSGARNVIDAVCAAITAIAEHPLSAERTSYAGIHVKNVRRYRYKIFYLVGVDQVEIFARAPRGAATMDSGEVNDENLPPSQAASRPRDRPSRCATTSSTCMTPAYL